MKNILTKMALLAAIAIIVSCSSAVTLADMEKQRDKTMKEVESAQEAMIELANMKEAYSEDYRDAKIAALKTRDKALKKDVDRLESVETQSAQGAAGDMVKGLNDQRASVETELNKFEKTNKENWQSTRDSINREIALLKGHIEHLTQSLANDTPIEK